MPLHRDPNFAPISKCQGQHPSALLLRWTHRKRPALGGAGALCVWAALSLSAQFSTSISPLHACLSSLMALLLLLALQTILVPRNSSSEACLAGLRLAMPTTTTTSSYSGSIQQPTTAGETMKELSDAEEQKLVPLLRQALAASFPGVFGSSFSLNNFVCFQQ